MGCTPSGGAVFVSIFQTAHPVKLRNARRLIFQIPFDVIGETPCSLFFYSTVLLHGIRILTQEFPERDMTA